MGWIRTLTLAQRRILGALALSVAVVIGLLVWSVWSTLQQPQAPSPLPTPSAPPATAAPTASATPTPTPTATPLPTAVATFDISRAGIIASEVAEARQVSERWGTPLTLVDDIGLARVLHTHYQANPPLAIRIRPVLTTLHLWFWDPLRVDVVTQAQRAVSFYSPQLRELYLRRDWAGPQETLEIQLAHGYARAIPEHVGNLRALQEEALAGSTATLDRALTLQAVAEGDALIAVLLHQGIAPGSPRAEQIQNDLAGAVCPVWQANDPLLKTLSCIAFELGAGFATTLYQEGGVAALDAAIVRPPRSTKEILHPDLYLQPPAADGTGAGEETRLLIPLEPALGRGWTLTMTETLGEAMTGVILQEWSPEIIEPDAVAGWSGDLLQAWETTEGERVAMWQITWEGSAIAGRFYGHLLNVLPGALVSGSITDTTPAAGIPRGRWWSGDEGSAFLYRYREQIWLIWGTDSAAVEAAAAAIP